MLFLHYTESCVLMGLSTTHAGWLFAVRLTRKELTLKISSLVRHARHQNSDA